MPRKNRIVVTKADVARVLAILDSHSNWPHRRIHHLELRKALEQARSSLLRKPRLMSSWVRLGRYCSAIVKVTKSSRRCQEAFNGCRSRR
jgi:hypothetical protein